MTADKRAGILGRLSRLAGRLRLPEVTEGTSYGAPALKVRGKSFVVVKDAGTLALMMALEQKELLMAAAPEIYYETPHYHGWPAVLVRLAAIPDDELGGRLVEAWRRKAPRTLAKAYDAETKR